jgi:hypothetical protein
VRSAAPPAPPFSSGDTECSLTVPESRAEAVGGGALGGALASLVAKATGGEPRDAADTESQEGDVEGVGTAAGGGGDSTTESDRE